MLCDIDRRDYQLAQKKLERLLQSDPKNIQARKILLHVEAKQIKRDDKSPENMALIRKVIEGYTEALNTFQLTAEEKQQADKSLFYLYEQLGQEELKKELLRRAADANRTPTDRAEAYVVLASTSWNCSFSITSKQQPERGAAPKAEIEKANACVAEGLGQANQAITLVPENESAWSYKVNLLKEASTLAGIEGNQTQKVSYQNQYNQALKQYQQISARQQAEREKESAGKDEARTDPESPEKAAEFSKELVEFKAENSLEKVISELFPIEMELTSPFPSADKREPSTTSSQSSAQQKHEWKTLTPDEDLTLDLPDNVGPIKGGYSATSEGVIYTIMSVARPASQTDAMVTDGILNTLARTYMGFLNRDWLSGGLANRFEIKLLRKEEFNKQPRKVYTYTLNSCSEKKDGLLMVQTTQRHYYLIDIRGAGETEPRVQRVLSSLKVK